MANNHGHYKLLSCIMESSYKYPRTWLLYPTFLVLHICIFQFKHASFFCYLEVFQTSFVSDLSSKCLWTVSNFVAELSPNSVSVNCLISELSPMSWHWLPSQWWFWKAVFILYIRQLHTWVLAECSSASSLQYMRQGLLFLQQLRRCLLVVGQMLPFLAPLVFWFWVRHAAGI